MTPLGPHADFIIGAYAVAICVVAGLIVWVLVDHRVQRKALADMETRGVKRRARRKG
jgi:heme exporter protein D